MGYVRNSWNKWLPILGLWVVLCGGVIVAQPAAESRAFHAGNEAYAAGDYQKAVASFEQCVRETGESVQLLYNLGNSHFKNGQLGRAIAAYERALAFAPRDHALRSNLELARHAAGVELPTRPWWQAAAEWLSFNEWTILLGGAGGIMAVLLLLGAFGIRRARLRAPAWFAGLLLLSSGAGMWWTSPVLTRAITLDQARLLVSPVPEAEDVCVIGAGQRLSIHKSHGGFHLVQALDGRRGWIEQGAVQPLFSP